MPTQKVYCDFHEEEKEYNPVDKKYYCISCELESLKKFKGLDDERRTHSKASRKSKRGTDE